MKRSLRTIGAIFLSSFLVHSQQPIQIPAKQDRFHVVTIYNSYDDFYEAKATQAIQIDVQRALQDYRKNHPNTTVIHHSYNLANHKQVLNNTNSQNYSLDTTRTQKTLEHILNNHPHKPINKLILGFHGSKESITTHATYKQGTIKSYKLSTQDIDSFFIKPFVFEKDAEILLLSCQAAKGKRNVAQALANATHQNVKASPHAYFGTIVYDTKTRDLALASNKTRPGIGPLTSSFLNPKTQDTILLQLGEPYLFNRTQDKLVFSYSFTKQHVTKKTSYQEYTQIKKILTQECTLLEEDIAQSKFMRVYTSRPSN